MSSPLRIAVVGASGRMGASVIRLAHERGLTIVRAIGQGAAGRDVGELAGVGRIGVVVEAEVEVLAAGGFDAVIDFSSPDILPELAAIAAVAGAALVSGTTGVARDGEVALGEASRRIPILWEPNLSVGVHLLGDLLRRAIAALGDGFDIEIVETHHRKKVDAPSGTALRLAAIADETAGGRELRHGREGMPGARGAREVGLHAVRGGDVVGDHSVHLIGQGERLELVHRATNRDVFAHGAIRAAIWLVGKPAGRYGLGDVLG